MTTTKNMACDEKEELLSGVYQGGTAHLKDVDPEVFVIIKAEEHRQRLFFAQDISNQIIKIFLHFTNNCGLDACTNTSVPSKFPSTFVNLIYL